MPKILSTPFKAQVITLSAFHPKHRLGWSQLIHSFCALYARCVLKSSALDSSDSQSSHLYVLVDVQKDCLCPSKGCHTGLSTEIALAYSSKGVECPIGVRAHSTRGLASSWAWANGISIQDICMVAGWSSPSSFVRSYNLDVSSLASHVLSVWTAHTPTQPQLWSEMCISGFDKVEYTLYWRTTNSMLSLSVYHSVMI